MKPRRNEDLPSYITRLVAHHIVTMETEGGRHDGDLSDRLDNFLSDLRVDVIHQISQEQP